jgi:hypothetical protein
MTSSPDAPARTAALAALDSVLAGLAELADVQSWAISEDDLASLARGLDSAGRLATAQGMRVAAEAASRGLPARAGHARLEHWVRDQVPTMAPRAAAAHARRTERLFTSAVATELAPTRAALLAGAVSAEQADVVASTLESLCPPKLPAEVVAAETLDAAQGFLLEQAGYFDPTALRRLADYLRHRLDPGADDRLAKDEDAQQHQRLLTLSPTAGGMVQLGGLLTARAGAALRTAIDAASAPQTAADGTPDPRSAAQRRHDALHHLAERAIAIDQLPSVHGSAYRIVVHVDAQGSPELADGTAISQSTLDELSCSAEVVPVAVAADGTPLDVGRTQRLFTTRQRLALAVRDRGCTYPNCSAPVEWCDAHHLTSWEAGGRTDLDNAALVCGRHHRHLHRTGVTGRVDNGQVYWDTGPPRQPAPPTITTARRLVHQLLRRRR